MPRAIIENFQPINNRPDSGQMFENFIIAEAIKSNDYEDWGYKLNFWRTKQGSEVGVVLSKAGGELKGVEIKTPARAGNKAFVNRYPQAKIRVVRRRGALLGGREKE
jgi:predicted AAA+ superfamily ATPase